MKKPATTSASPRRSIATVSILGTTQLHLRNPLVIAFWSLMFPGLGHILLSKYIRGFLLFIWEVIVNTQAHVNESILYSLLGRFDLAKSVVDIQWALLYIPTYLFAVWDSYRTSVDINKTYQLAAREDAEIKPFAINAAGINYLDKGSPWVAAAWSILSPGAGQIIMHRIITAFFIMIWWVVIVYFSALLPSIQSMLFGRIEEAKGMLNPQWFLNLPSVYCFAIYDAYVNTVESNKLFEWEQSKFLRREYQDVHFPFPASDISQRGGGMYVVSTFEHTLNLESAVTALQMAGVAKKDILAVPLDKKNDARRLFDTMHMSDSMSLLDLPVILGTILTMLGSVYGFILPIGPVFAGMAGAVVGFGAGLVIKLLSVKRRQRGTGYQQKAEVVLFISCEADKIQAVQDMLWANSALGVGKLSPYENE